MQYERQKSNKVGESGFVHFYGVVEDRNDPKRLGRLRVRIFGDHTEQLSELPTSDLPWAQVVLPINGAPNSAPNAWDGQLVFGFYADGHEKQVPVIIGQVAGDGEAMLDDEGKKDSGFQDQREKKAVRTPENNDAARGVNTGHSNPDKYNSTIQKKIRTSTKHSNLSYNEPEDQTAAEYPYNTAFETESGHLIEYDDTPDNERINIFHRSGSRVELLKDGSVVYKSVEDSHTVSNKNIHTSSSDDNNRYTGGDVNDTTAGSYTLKVNGGDLSITVSGNVNMNVSGNVNQNVSGSYDIKAGTFNVKAGKINLN